MISNKDISIVGGGLVGSLLACYMQKKGLNVNVYESRGDMRSVGYIGGRSINLALSTRGWTALEKVGLTQEIEAISIPMYGRVIHQKDGSTDYQPYGKENEAIYSVSRGELNKRLVELADNFDNVKFHFNQFCQNVDLQKGEATFLNTETQQLTSVKDEMIIGTDGAFSKVRASMYTMPRFDYQQFYINYGYKELTIPAGPNGSFLIDKNALHIWPRGEFMMIALPNLDGSFTCTLFVPFEGENAFDDLTSESEVKAYFENHFPDAMQLMPTLIEDFFKNPTSALVTVTCFPWHKNNVALMGDAVHAIVPFFGQGMNCGFEDVRVFDELFEKHTDVEEFYSEFEDLRKENADAIAQMALDNFIEMRDLVGDKEFLRRKHIEHEIMENPSYNYTSMYQYVSFSNEPYSFAYQTGKKQYKMLEELSKIENIEDKLDTEEVKQIVNAIN
jgi:kynurenine 3-monooxygenase